MAKIETLRTNLGPLDALWIVLALVAGSWGLQTPGLGLLCGIAMGAAIGVWRLVRIQAKQLEFQQEEHYAEQEYSPDQGQYGRS
jgi:uncharacterized membrane protein